MKNAILFAVSIFFLGTILLMIHVAARVPRKFGPVYLEARPGAVAALEYQRIKEYQNYHSQGDKAACDTVERLGAVVPLEAGQRVEVLVGGYGDTIKIRPFGTVSNLYTLPEFLTEEQP